MKHVQELHSPSLYLAHRLVGEVIIIFVLIYTVIV